MIKELMIKTGRALYGERWQTDLAKDLKLKDARRVRQWLSDDRPIPAGIKNDLINILKERKLSIESILAEHDDK